MIPESTGDERKCQRKWDFASSVAYGSASSELCWDVTSLQSHSWWCTLVSWTAGCLSGPVSDSEGLNRACAMELLVLAFRLARSSYVASMRAVAQPLALLCTCCLSFLSPRETSIQETATKNTYLYIIANQIVKKSRVELDDWVLSLSVPKCLFHPYICWCDLQSILVTKHRLSPASSCLKIFPIGRNCILTRKSQIKLTCSMGSWSWGAHPQSLSTTR